MQTSKISSKQSSTLSINPCLSLLTFSRWTLIHIIRTSVQSNTNNGFFELIIASFYTGCKSTWLSAIRTHWFGPALPAFNAHIRKNASYRNL